MAPTPGRTILTREMKQSAPIEAMTVYEARMGRLRRRGEMRDWKPRGRGQSSCPSSNETSCVIAHPAGGVTSYQRLVVLLSL
jgi:hypothetical protein